MLMHATADFGDRIKSDTEFNKMIILKSDMFEVGLIDNNNLKQ